MTDREKLIELLKDSPMLDVLYQTETEWECAADYLISHGVTVQELDGCSHCRNAVYTEKPFTVITQMGYEVKTQFNFCPMCGRRLHTQMVDRC
jgi:hypothetical protein